MTAKFFELVHPSFGMLKVQKLSNNAALLKRSTDGAAGYDLCALQDCTVPAGGKGLVHTGLAISFPARSLCQDCSQARTCPQEVH